MFSITAALLIASAVATPVQLPFLQHATPNADSLLTVQVQPAGSKFDYHLAHAHFPGHQVRIRQPNLCDSVQEWSGYLDARGRHFYFWSYESRNDPANDPVISWFNGGPGCSSFTGMLMELGPCSVDRTSKSSEVELRYNPYGWNSNATVIFIDQPAGVGYSYSDPGTPDISSTEQAAEDIYAFLTIWFQTFNRRFGKSSLHLAGESYAGRYIPVFADYIVQQNKNESSPIKLNLESVLIGNGFTHQTLQYGAYFPTVCSAAGGYGPYVNESACHQMIADLPECQRLMDLCAKDVSNTKLCIKAYNYCEKTQADPYYETGRNPYDMDKFGAYPEEAWVHSYLNRKDVRHELGVDHEEGGGVREFIGCSDKVGEDFAATGDNAKPSYQHVTSLLENGVRALIYAGSRDFICNAIGVEQWTLLLEWSGRSDFRKQPLTPWRLPGDGRAGLYRSSGNLTYATVDASGHFVPHDQPRRSLAMATNWIHFGPSAFADKLTKH